jgi:hypothetical protein
VFASWGDVSSQFPTLGHQGRGSFQPLVTRYAVLFPTSCVILYVLSKHDTLACFVCLGFGPSVTQRPAVIFPIYLLLSNVRVGKYPLVTNLVRPVLARAGGQSQYSPALTSAVQSTEVNYVVGSLQENVSHNLRGCTSLGIRHETRHENRGQWVHVHSLQHNSGSLPDV